MRPANKTKVRTHTLGPEEHSWGIGAHAEPSFYERQGKLKKLAPKLRKDVSSTLKDQGIETENMEEFVSVGLHFSSPRLTAYGQAG